jgi:hypothetical protein
MYLILIIGCITFFFIHTLYLFIKELYNTEYKNENHNIENYTNNIFKPSSIEKSIHQIDAEKTYNRDFIHYLKYMRTEENNLSKKK